MKKLIAILLAVLMLFTFAACSKEEKKAEVVTYGFLEETIGVETYNIGFRKGDNANRDMIVGGLKAIVENGTFEKIAVNYPDIKDYLTLKKGDFSNEKLPAKGSYAGTKFTQGFDLDYPPYSYRGDDGKVGGFDVEVCQALCEYLGVEYNPLSFNWDAKDAELAAGSCDCIWSGFTYEGRENDYLWGIAYSANTQAIMVGSNSGIKTLADLKGKLVGVQTATSALDLLEGDRKDLKATFKELKVYETYTVAFQDLKAGAIDAIAIDITAGSFLIANEAK